MRGSLGRRGQRSRQLSRRPRPGLLSAVSPQRLTEKSSPNSLAMSDVELPADVPGSPGSGGDYVESPVDLPTVDCCKKDCLQCLRTSPFLAQAQSRLLGNVERLGQAGRALHGAGHGAPCAHGGAAPAGPASRQRGVRCGASVAVLVRQRLWVTSAPATGELGYGAEKEANRRAETSGRAQAEAGAEPGGQGRGWSPENKKNPGQKKKIFRRIGPS